MSKNFGPDGDPAYKPGGSKDPWTIKKNEMESARKRAELRRKLRARQVAAYNRAAKKKDMESYKNSTPPVYPS